MAKGERLVREIEYFKRLSQPVSLRRFAKDHNIANSTAQLDLELLQDLGCKFSVTKGFHGGYLLVEGPETIDFVLDKEQVKLWNVILEKSSDAEKRLLKYVMKIAEEHKILKL